jgi:squalene-hopene/tetraprenyl-beta-curcumene cyclase
MCTSALIRNGVPVENPQIQQSLSFIVGMVQPDGGIYAPGSNLRNYETSVAIMCLAQSDQLTAEPRYQEIITQATNFLKEIQWDQGEGHQPISRHYGGQGYGKHQRPDASNTSFFLDALKEVKTETNSVAMNKAIVFISRCQNLPTPHNDAQFAQVVGDDDRGGFVYSAVGEGETKAESNSNTPVGGLRSYASMTYAGLKSFLYAGIDKDDIRVQAALDWISRHYDLQSNPGVGQQGLFYYYHVFAKALAAYEQPVIKTADGEMHNWRNDLIKVLAEKQQSDGSWTNPSDRWYEGDPNLVTSYCLLALSYCK